jgi:hypothetical protein
MRLRRVYATATYFYFSAYGWPKSLERKQPLHDLTRDALRLLPSVVASLVIGLNGSGTTPALQDADGE